MKQNQTRKFRGGYRQRDYLLERIIAPICKICGVPMLRRFDKNGKLEASGNFKKRKTCSKKCYIKYITGEKNPNYRGKLPVCIDCGKKVSYKNDGSVAKRCFDCYDKYMKKNNLYDKRNKLNGIKKRGKIPEHLKKFVFKSLN